MTSTEGSESPEERVGVLNGGRSPSCTESSDSGDGVTVLVTCALKEPVSKSDSLPPLLKKAAYIDPFSGKRGLSTVSLDVLTSGEHLNELSLEDLSFMGSGQLVKESSQGSIPDCQSLENEVKWEDCHIVKSGMVSGKLEDVEDEEGREGQGSEEEEEEEERVVQDARRAVSGQDRCQEDMLKQEGCPDQQEECPNGQERLSNHHQDGIQPNQTGQEERPDQQDGHPDGLGRPPNSPRTVVEGNLKWSIELT